MEVILFSLGSDSGAVTQQLDISPNTRLLGRSLCSTSKYDLVKESLHYSRKNL